MRRIIQESGIPRAQELVQRLEELQAQLGQVSQQARQAAREETRGLGERLAALADRLQALDRAVQLVSQYLESRREGQKPREALQGAVKSQLQDLENRLEERFAELSTGRIATALSWVGVPSVAAVVIAFFLSRALHNRVPEKVKK